MHRMRSWLFAPGDSEKKMAKAADGAADVVLLDLEDSVSPENKPAARELVAAFLASRSDRERLWVRINPLAGGETERDLEAVMCSAPGGLFLPKAEGRADVEALDRMLSALEAQHGIAQARRGLPRSSPRPPRRCFIPATTLDRPGWWR